MILWLSALPLHAQAQAQDLPPVLKLKLHTFPDVTMGVPVSHTVVLPEGWTSSGQTEWSVGELAYPQHNFEIRSPEGARIHFLPALNANYVEMAPVPGFQPMPPQGVAPPQDFGRWLASVRQQAAPPVQNLVLVSSQRQPQIEQMYDKMQRDAGIDDRGMQREVYVVTLEYDEANVRRRDEALMLYVRYAPIINQNLRSQMWSVFTTFIVSAPKEKYERLKQELYTVAGSVRPSPQWWTQSQALLAELSRIRAEQRWESIRRRGQMINQMSDADYARYKRAQAGSDASHRNFIKSIYETDDFRDTGGQIVNLPMHYRHVFSDGQGNYFLTNNSLDKPGERWTQIERMK